jgi:CSLREA domain-containing protein
MKSLVAVIGALMLCQLVVVGVAATNRASAAVATRAPVANQTARGTLHSPRRSTPAVPVVTFVVNSALDTTDADPSDGTCADSAGRCTLRAAITASNWSHGENRIEFNIAGTAPVLIQLDTALPTLLLQDRSGGVVIDGYTQPGSQVNTATVGSNAIPGVQLRGTGKAHKQTALRMTSAGNTVRGIEFNNNYRSIVLDGADAHDNQIIGNWIGFTAPGVVAKYNGHYNMYVSNGAHNNAIGTPALADRNVSGGAIKGMALYGPGTDYNTIQNNIFCITPDGSATAECAVGIDFAFGPQHNLIGGSGQNERNVFGRTRQNGIEFAHGIDNGSDETWHNDYNEIIGNWIGFRADGSYDVNYLSGFHKPSSSNDANGIDLADGSSYNLVEGNYIGATWDGVNLMWANETGNIIRNNIIGRSPLGQAAPLGRYGINVRNAAYGHTIEGNTISNAAVYGISLTQKDVVNIRMSQNLITDMTGTAIHLAVDPANAANGANHLLAAPVITTATTSLVVGTGLVGATVEVYRASRAAGKSGLPVEYLGSATVAPDGHWSVVVSVASSARVTALQIAPNNDTSALGKNRSITAP